MGQTFLLRVLLARSKRITEALPGASRFSACSALRCEAVSPSKLYWRGWGDTIATLMHETMLRVQPRALVSARWPACLATWRGEVREGAVKGSGWNVRNGKPRDQEA